MAIHRVERLWLITGSAMLVAFLAILLVNATAMGSAPPSSMDMIDPGTVLAKGEFGSPGIIRTGPHAYTVRIAAYTFGFTPSAISVPAGATVTFRLASRDVVHGFSIVDTDVNTMIIPGYVSEVQHTFPHRGSYLIICNEYCGTGHQYMYAKLTVV